MRLAHIGIAVKSLDESVTIFEKIFNVKATPVEFVEDQKVNVRKFHLENCDIELLEGTSADSPVRKFIEKKGEGIHHISFGVEDILGTLSNIKLQGIRVVDEIPKSGADNLLIAFLHPNSTKVLIELTEKT